MERVMLVNAFEQDMALAAQIAAKVKQKGGRVMMVGGAVRDSLLGIQSKDIDLEVYALSPEELRGILGEFGEIVEKGVSFGVYALAHSNIDIAMPRRENQRGLKHADFDVSVDPGLSFRQASMRRDFTINAMMRDVLTGELVDLWGGVEDLRAGIIRRVNAETFREDALRVFRAAQFAARLKARIEPQTLSLCREMDVTHLSVERVFEELSKALLKSENPSVFFRALLDMDHLVEYFPELQACRGVEQNPLHHPEGDVFEHTMRVVDQAAGLRETAVWPLGFMLSALFHDLGKTVTTRSLPDGRIVSYRHEIEGLGLCDRQMRRLTNQTRLIEYVKNMMWLHMRPNVLAASRSRKKKTRLMFDLSLCPEDLILLSKADVAGKGGPPGEDHDAFLRERLEDYRSVIKRPMVTGADLVKAGCTPGPLFACMLRRARELHFAGFEKDRALKQVMAEAAGGRFGEGEHNRQK